MFEKEDLVANSAKMGKHLAKRLDEVKEKFPFVGDRRGLGLMQAIEFVDTKGRPDADMRDKVEEACWKRGLVILACGKSSLRIIPALNITAQQLDGGLDVVEEALRVAKA